MAVKCNIPDLALKSIHSVLYGFNCENFTQKIVQNYLEYLKCPGVDYSFCDDFPCVAPSGTVFCSIDDINLSIGTVTIDSATVTFVAPSQPYVIQLIKVSDNSIVDTKTNPTSPIVYTGLIPNTEYKVHFQILCEGGETKTEDNLFTTLPTCVEITDYTGVIEEV